MAPFSRNRESDFTFGHQGHDRNNKYFGPDVFNIEWRRGWPDFGIFEFSLNQRQPAEEVTKQTFPVFVLVYKHRNLYVIKIQIYFPSQ